MSEPSEPSTVAESGETTKTIDNQTGASHSSAAAEEVVKTDGASKGESSGAELGGELEHATVQSDPPSVVVADPAAAEGGGDSKSKAGDGEDDQQLSPPAPSTTE